jgi:formamidopyrimidine-DNA glycosylase
MPELPEVETIRTELNDRCLQRKITNTIVYNSKLRYPVTNKLGNLLYNQTILRVFRRGRYLLFAFDNGNLIIHLGMSGELSIKDLGDYQKKKHEHITFFFDNDIVLSFCDPRKFGSVVFSSLTNVEEHKLLKNLGPEPLTENFSGTYLYQLASKTTKPIKSLLMDNNCVTGIGNIYVAEILFISKINPSRPAKALTLDECNTICQRSKDILNNAIHKGGTTIKDFKKSNGTKGYFQQDLKVYGRNNKNCHICDDTIVKTTINQRSTYSCKNCQK